MISAERIHAINHFCAYGVEVPKDDRVPGIEYGPATPEEAAELGRKRNPTVFDKAARMEDALRAEYNTLKADPRDFGHATGAIDIYLQDATDESKARLFDLIMGAK